jgi:hypothetical protein
LTNSGGIKVATGRGCLCKRALSNAFAASTPPRRAAAITSVSRSPACNERKPGVFGELTVEEGKE